MASRTSQRVEEKKSQILAHAKEILIHKGRRTHMADIAEASGMETSSLYYYFKGIPDVLNALLNDQYRDLHEFELEVSSAGLNSLEALRSMVEYLIEFYHENLELIQITLRHCSPLFHLDEVDEDAEAVNDFLHACNKSDTIMLRYLRCAQKDGTCTSDYPAETLLYMLRGAMWGIVASWQDHCPSPSRIPGYVDRALRVVT